MKSYFNITKYNYEDSDYLNEWGDIQDFIDNFGSDDISIYLHVESDFVKLMLKFSKFFENRLAVKIFFEEKEYFESISINHFKGLILPFDETYFDIQSKSFDALTKKERFFIFQCHMRGLCIVHLIDATTLSFLKPMHDPFYFWVGLDDSLCIWDIFPKTTGIYIYHDMDHDNDDVNYLVPDDFGKKLA